MKLVLRNFWARPEGKLAAFVKSGFEVFVIGSLKLSVYPSPKINITPERESK